MSKPRPGSIYCLRVRRRWGTPARGYIGQTRYRDYRRRVEQHLYGYWWGHEWKPPQYWAADVVDYDEVWHSERVRDWRLDLMELIFIRLWFPVHNDKLNHGNPRRVIPPPRNLRCYPDPSEITAVERHQRPRKDRKGRPVPEHRIQVRRDGAIRESGRTIRTRIYQ